jgi:surfeit locus 1 family protein
VTTDAPGRQPSGGRGQEGRPSASRSALTLFFLGLLVLFGIAGFTALGVWQIERRAWKLDLIDRVEQRIHAPAMQVPPPEAWPAINTTDDAYRRVTVDGRFLYDRETLVQALTDHGGGFWVMTPLQTGKGEVILVNRGFIPSDLRDPATRREGNPAGEAHVVGLMRMTEPKGSFLRTNDSATERWYTRDVSAIAAVRGLQRVAPFFIDADATPNSGGWPLGGLTVVSFPNNHLIYALTWFTLALMVCGAAVFVGREEWRLRKGDINSDPI